MEIVGIFNGYIKQTFELDPHYEYIDNKSAFGPLSRYECTLTVPGLRARLVRDYGDYEEWTDHKTGGIGQQKKHAQQIACQKFAQYLVEKGVVEGRKFPGLEVGKIKPIEVKAAIFSGFGKRKYRLPEYHLVEDRSNFPPEKKYYATMRIDIERPLSGDDEMEAIEKETKGEGGSKKDAQTEAAWHMATFLVEQHVLGLDELPPFPPGFEPRLPEPEPADPPAANSLLASLSADLPQLVSLFNGEELALLEVADCLGGSTGAPPQQSSSSASNGCSSGSNRKAAFFG